MLAALRIAGASSEVDNTTGRLNGNVVLKTQCPNCGFLADVTPGKPTRCTQQSRTAATVFSLASSRMNRESAHPNAGTSPSSNTPAMQPSITSRRLVGLPGEELLIENGDIHVRAPGEQDYSIARKSHAKVRAMMQPVHDNDNVPVELYKNGWPLAMGIRTIPVRRWIPSADFRSYKTEGPAVEPAWLRYTRIRSLASATGCSLR